jgi:Lipocalin-like domain
MKAITVKFLLLGLILFSACNTENKNGALIIGKWQGTAWLVNGQPSSNNAAQTTFTFNDKNLYTFDYAGTVEKGTYKIDHQSLYTTADKQQEMMVYVEKLTTDSLIFNMNRGGQAETLILVKAK